MKIRNMTRCAVLAAVLTACAWISIPLGHQAISMQTFGVFLTLGLLGGRDGCLTVLVYLLLGSAGVPVFSGFRGGIAVLLGPTGGYLWGFLAAGVLYWALEKRLAPWLNMIPGMLVCYTCGTVWYYYMYESGAIWPVIATCVVPYLLPDAIKLLLAFMLTNRLKQYIR